MTYFVAHFRSRWAVYKRRSHSSTLVNIFFSKEEAYEEAERLNNISNNQ